MKRTVYFNLCEEKLSILCARVEMRGKLNILDFHLHSEDFYAHFFNRLYGYSLQNLNAVSKNVEGIDLVDSVNSIVLQVSATATKAKIEAALSKNLAVYRGHKFNFVSISKDASHLRTLEYANPHDLIFVPTIDIHDLSSILGHIKSLEISKQSDVHDFLQKELGFENVKPAKTNIAAIINLLAKQELLDESVENSVIPFDVDMKISFNNLKRSASLIESHKIYHSQIERTYAEFDIAGKNKSKSVLNAFSSRYLRLKDTYSCDDLFFKIIDDTIDLIIKSANYEEILLEELTMWVEILAVDAFIRCKIFANPMEQANVAS